MSTSFQREIPKARINITLDVETGAARKNIELPFNILVLGDFSQGKAQGLLSEREKFKVSKNNINHVLASIKPEIQLNLPNAINSKENELSAKLKFEAIKDFRPENIVTQIPELRNLLAMRNLLKDLRSNLIDNVEFRKEIEKIIKDKKQLQDLRQLLNSVVSEDME